jgi:hypothetical protein
MAARGFSVNFTNASGERVLEHPRLVVTADGKHKSLLLSDSTVLASVPYDTSDTELWTAARAKVNGGTSRN